MAECKSAANGILKFLVDISLFGKPSSRLVQQTMKVGHIKCREKIPVVQMADKVFFLFDRLDERSGGIGIEVTDLVVVFSSHSGVDNVTCLDQCKTIGS